MEITNKKLNELYGITEWNEKAKVLSLDEKEEALRNIEAGVSTPLVESLYKPFPEFAVEYFKKYPGMQKFLEDPAFGYKFYLFSSTYYQSIKAFFCFNEVLPQIERDRSIINAFKEYFRMPLDQIPKIMSSKSYFKALVSKYIYLTKYIDLEEAERLGIDTTLFKSLGENGYELDKKLELFNPVERAILEKYYGLKGEKMPLTEIIQTFNISKDKVEKFIKLIEPLMAKSYSILKNKLEPIGEVDGTKLYANVPYKTLDLGITSNFIYNHALNEEEKEAYKMNGRSTFNPGLIYVIKNYVFPSMSISELGNYLNADFKRLESIETKGSKSM